MRLSGGITSGAGSVGGGPGAYAAWLCDRGDRVHVVDPIPLHVEQATAAHPRVTGEVGDARHLQQESGSVDAILLMGPLYHLVERPERLRALAEAKRVLRPGGVLLAAAISRFAELLDLLVAEVLPRRSPAAGPPGTSSTASSSPTTSWPATRWGRRPPQGRPTHPQTAPGENAPEALLETVAAGTRPARWPWPERDLAFVATALLAGLRLSELIGLNLGSIDGRPGERRIHVVGKGRKERVVPIEEPLHDVINRRGDRLKRGGTHYLVERSYRAAGLANRVPAGAMVHALRHTFATRFAEDGASATEIQALLGHESLNTSQGYIDATANATRQAARANRTYRALRRLVPEPRPDRPEGASQLRWLIGPRRRNGLAGDLHALTMGTSPLHASKGPVRVMTVPGAG
ncbi:MAG TPA: tyrosine-type recombinase/integrase [Acidimicrobiia bacterium]|nr:tyrosine-type recombinase/integrase [Acidimicrobiia bacterium]